MRRTTAVLTAAALALGLAACAEEAAGPRDVTVELSDYAFGGLPSGLPAGSTITVDNTSDTELHELVAVLLPEDETRSADELVALPPDEMGALFAGVKLVELQAPGSDEVIPAVGDGTLTETGRYFVLCAIPTGADPGEYLAAAAETEEGPPQGVAGGPPHFVNGMYGEVLVTG